MIKNYLKKHIQIILSIIFIFGGSISIIKAQINIGIYPKSFQEKLIWTYQEEQITPLSQTFIASKMAEPVQKGEMMTISALLPVDISMSSSGTWHRLSDGTDVWQLSLSCANAKALALHFDDFKLSEGAQLFVYTEDRSLIFGPYTSKDSCQSGFSIGLLTGDHLIIEYENPKIFESEVETVLNDFHIAKISYVYRNEGLLKSNLKSGYGDSESCEVNVNCSEGENWRLQQKGVARIYVVDYDNNTAGWCSGSLVNNTLQDGTPYFLTADHCGGSSSDYSMSYWLFYFSYEEEGCTQASEPYPYVISGAAKIARAPIEGGSDFLLLKLNTTLKILKNIGAVYNGWSNQNVAANYGVAIHHPNGDVKKISTYTQKLKTGTYRNSLNNAHWTVQWSKTQNGYGVTEGGSSGSPIFNSNGLIVGTLTGGYSYCQDTTGIDYYGKMSSHWTSNGTSDTSRLKPWLSFNTSVTYCNYYDPNEINKLIINPDVVSLGATQAIDTIKIVSGQDTALWNAYTSVDWITVLPKNGLGLQDSIITITAEDNESDTVRTTSVLFIQGTDTVVVSVIQYFEGEKNCLTLNENLYKDGGTIYSAGTGGYITGSNSYGDVAKAGYFSADQVSAVSKVKYTYNIEGGNGNMIFKIWKNDGGTGLPGNEMASKTVSMSELYNIADSISSNVRQGSYEWVLDTPSYVNGGFYIGMDLSSVESYIGLISTIDGIYTNTAWDKHLQQWLSMPKSWDITGITMAIQPTLCPITDGYLYLDSNTLKVPYTAGSYDVNVYSNVGWSVTKRSGTWLSLTPAIGLLNGSFTMTALVNTTTKVRTGYIAVEGTGLLAQTIVVKQAAKETTDIADYVNATTQLKIYPNPFQNSIQIMSQGIFVRKVDICDIYGRLLISRMITTTDDFEIDLSDLSEGGYIVKIETSDGQISKKMIKL